MTDLCSTKPIFRKKTKPSTFQDRPFFPNSVSSSNYVLGFNTDYELL